MTRYLKFFVVILLAVIILVVVIIGISYTQPAIADDYKQDMPHMHMSGHWFPPECCSMRDCYKIDASDVQATPDGYVLKSTQETIPYSLARRSPDGYYYKCTSNADPMAPVIHPMGRSMCFFPPEQGS